MLIRAARSLTIDELFHNITRNSGEWLRLSRNGELTAREPLRPVTKWSPMHEEYGSRRSCDPATSANFNDATVSNDLRTESVNELLSFTARRDRLRARVTLTSDMARRWYAAHQAVALPGENLPSFGCVAQTVYSLDDRHKHLVRWHNGTFTMTWISGRHLNVGEWIVVRTVWDDEEDGAYTAERSMRVTEMLDVMPANAQRLHDEYWEYNRELREFEFSSLLNASIMDGQQQ